VEVPREDPDFDDGRVEEIPVQVTSDSDAVGEEVVCVETTAGSRLFRSQRPVNLYPTPKEVNP